MMGLRALLLTAGLLWPLSSASAQESFIYFLSGNELIDYCASPSSDKHLYCNGYLSGVADALFNLKVACPPEDVTRSQAVAVVMKRLRLRPEIRNRPAAEQATLALTEAFPCK